MATPSQQTNQILELMQRLGSDARTELWTELGELVERRQQGQRQTRQEFEDRARARGEQFEEQARPRMEPVLQGFDQYEAALSDVRETCAQQDTQRLEGLQQQLAEATCRLFDALDHYAAFYFSWGENQSPLVTMIRQAVESYSRNALQSTQAQRILQDMQEHFQTLSTSEEKRRGQEEKSSGT